MPAMGTCFWSDSGLCLRGLFVGLYPSSAWLALVIESRGYSPVQKKTGATPMSDLALKA